MKDADIHDTLRAVTRCLIQADKSASPASLDAASIGSLILASQLLVQTCEGLLVRIKAHEVASVTAANYMTHFANGDTPAPDPLFQPKPEPE